MLVVIAVKETYQILWDRIPSTYKKAMVFTDYWEAYQAIIPNEKHFPVGKKTGGTSHVERRNNTLNVSFCMRLFKALPASDNTKLLPTIDYVTI